jgi:acetyltransferase-like isoleucine patch superfamily enzyme
VAGQALRVLAERYRRKGEPGVDSAGVDSVSVQASADVDERAELGAGTTVWHLAQVREHARLGRGCIVGRGAYVGPGVIIGDRVKLQNYALVYEPARLADEVFIGPGAVLTNDVYPRSASPSGVLKRPADWQAEGVVVREGASLGARAVVVAGCVIGRWALVAAGAVVTRDVPDFALVAGVPASQVPDRRDHRRAIQGTVVHQPAVGEARMAGDHRRVTGVRCRREHPGQPPPGPGDQHRPVTETVTVVSEKLPGVQKGPIYRPRDQVIPVPAPVPLKRPGGAGANFGRRHSVISLRGFIGRQPSNSLPRADRNAQPQLPTHRISANPGAIREIPGHR